MKTIDALNMAHALCTEAADVSVKREDKIAPKFKKQSISVQEIVQLTIGEMLSNYRFWILLELSVLTIQQCSLPACGHAIDRV